MAQKHSRPPAYEDVVCLDGGATADFAEPRKPSDRTSTNIPKETARRLDTFSKATGIPIKEQVITAVDLYLKIHADADSSGDKLLPSRTHNRLQRLSTELETTEGWFARVGTSIMCAMLEESADGGSGRLFDEVYQWAVAEKKHVADLVADVLREALKKRG